MSTRTPIRRRLRNLSIHDYRIVARLYSLTTPGTGTDYDVAVDASTGEFTCTCPDHQYRKRACKHIRRLIEAGQRKAQELAR